MIKAYWRGRQIFDIDVYSNGWAKIAFWDRDSCMTGTGACWVDMDDITIEEVSE